MNDYPEARKFYMDRAWKRRIEFRRRQKKFIKKFIETKFNYFKTNPGRNNFDLDDDEDMSWDDDLIEGQEIGALEDQSDGSDENNKGTQPGQEEIKAFNASKFYYNFSHEKLDEELTSDIPIEELEEISLDENQSDNANLLEDDNREISKEHSDAIQEQINSMINVFGELSQTLEGNLESVQKYVKDLQQSSGKTDYPPIKKLNEVLSNAEARRKRRLNGDQSERDMTPTIKAHRNYHAVTDVEIHSPASADSKS